MTTPRRNTRDVRWPQDYPKRIDHPGNGLEAEIAPAIETLIQAFATDAGFFGDLTHATGLGHITDGSLQQCRIAKLGCRAQIFDGVLFAVNVTD